MLAMVLSNRLRARAGLCIRSVVVKSGQAPDLSFEFDRISADKLESTALTETPRPLHACQRLNVAKDIAR